MFEFYRFHTEIPLLNQTPIEQQPMADRVNSDILNHLHTEYDFLPGQSSTNPDSPRA